MKRAIAYLLILAMPMAILSCEKENLKTGSKSPAKTHNVVEADELSKVAKYIPPANPLNEYDSYGFEHNKMLDAFLEENGDMNESDFSVQFVADYFDLDQDFIDMKGLVDQYKDADPSAYSGDFLDYYQDNPEVFEYYFDLRSIILNPITTLVLKLEQVRILEATFDYSDVTADQAKVLKVASSIARHSMSYWAPVTQGGQGHADARRIDGWRVARADCVGAWMAAFSTANPFVALGWGAGSSAWDALDQRFS